MGNHGWKYIKHVLIREWLKESFKQALLHIRQVSGLTNEVPQIEKILESQDINMLDANTINNIVIVLKILKQKINTTKFKIKQKGVYEYRTKKLADTHAPDVIIKELEEVVKKMRCFANNNVEKLAAQLKDKYQKMFRALENRMQNISKEVDVLKKEFKEVSKVIEEKIFELAENTAEKFKSLNRHLGRQLFVETASNVNIQAGFQRYTNNFSQIINDKNIFSRVINDFINPEGCTKPAKSEIKKIEKEISEFVTAQGIMSNMERKVLFKDKIEEKKKELEGLKIQQIDLYAKIHGLIL